MVMLYLLLEPYLIYSFHGKSALEAAIEESRGADKEPPLTKEQQNLCGNAFDKLTKRELEVADSMLKGMSYTEIAKEFEINPSTVLVHQRNLYSKLQIHSKTELLRVAINADFYKDSEE